MSDLKQRAQTSKLTPTEKIAEFNQTSISYTVPERKDNSYLLNEWQVSKEEEAMVIITYEKESL